MKFYNLNNKNEIVSFEQATIKGQGTLKGLFFPEKIPQIEKDFFTHLYRFSNEEIGLKVMKPYVEEDIPEDVLKKIIAETVNFPFPLMRINAKIFSLELFHGPTLAFKDVGARFMSRCMGYFNRNNDQKTIVLVATSGDTGGAVANGFEGVENVEVVILYPSAKVSQVQELQLTTGGSNITALEVKGTFDDCQSIVKQVFEDKDLNDHLVLTSANSINVARWLPQQMYYMFAHKKWTRENEKEPVISVPSGNFGNICAGILAHISGLPVDHFIAACNVNDTIPRFLKSGDYEPKPAVATISNAMDVAEPSNFVRILELFNQQIPALKDKVTSMSVDDEETKKTIENIFRKEHYLLDPHGAVAYNSLEKYLENHNDKVGYILETAHPIKFPDVIQNELHIGVQVPDRLKGLFQKQKHSIKMDADFEKVKEFLLDKYSGI